MNYVTHSTYLQGTHTVMCGMHNKAKLKLNVNKNHIIPHFHLNGYHLFQGASRE